MHKHVQVNKELKTIWKIIAFQSSNLTQIPFFMTFDVRKLSYKQKQRDRLTKYTIFIVCHHIHDFLISKYYHLPLVNVH